MKLKEPRKFIASILLVYVILMSYFIASEFLEKPKPQIARQITGGTIGSIGINLVSQCTMNLDPEFNLISICANATNLSIAKILEGIAGQYDFVLKWNTATQEFDTYSPEAAENNFDAFELNGSYMIYMKASNVLAISGEQNGDMNVSLVEQYSAPSYPYTFAGNVTRYVSGISGGISFLSRWNASRQEFDTYSPEAAENPFNRIPKGEGQFIYMVAPAVLRYNKTDLQS